MAQSHSSIFKKIIGCRHTQQRAYFSIDLNMGFVERFWPCSRPPSAPPPQACSQICKFWAFILDTPRQHWRLERDMVGLHPTFWQLLPQAGGGGPRQQSHGTLPPPTPMQSHMLVFVVLLFFLSFIVDLMERV